MIRKTNKRKTNSKRKTNRRINKRKTIRRRKGGSNNNVNYNVQFQARRIRLMTNLQEVLEEMEGEINAGTNEINETTFVDRIREFEPEADEIDHYFGNHEMEELLNQTIDDIMERLGMLNNQVLNNNNNNNNTLSINSAYQINNNNKNNRNNKNNNKNWNM